MGTKGESWIDRSIRKHPIRYRWECFKLRVSDLWIWIKDGYVWNFSEEEPFLETFRTKRRASEDPNVCNKCGYPVGRPNQDPYEPCFGHGEE